MKLLWGFVGNSNLENREGLSLEEVTPRFFLELAVGKLDISRSP